MIQHIIDILKRFKDEAHYILLDETNEDLENKEEKLNHAIEYTIDNKIASLSRDIYLANMIKTDTWDIVRGDCDNYDGTVGWFYDYNNRVLRIYALGNEGGIALICYESTQPLATTDNRYARLQIHTLGEDDGYYFLASPSCYTECHGSVKEFSELMKVVLDKFNELENL